MSVITPGGLDKRLVALIAAMPGCQIDDLVKAAEDLRWDQVFAEIDDLSRQGRVVVTLRGRGEYTLSLPPDGQAETYPRCQIDPLVSSS